MSKPILLIDDEEKFAQMLQELLQASGFESDYCLNPEEALERLRREDFDLVITDYKMPQMDGAQFLQEARKINPDLPVIMISGLMNMPELIKVANIGVTLVLEKPFKTEELLEQVGRFVRTGGGEEAGHEAMEVEASEINFQQEAISVSYPSPASFISDASSENKRFLETLWKQANRFRHLPFHAQRGAEVRLLAREIMDWTGQDPESEVVRIDFIDTKTDFTRGWILESKAFPAVLVVDLRGSPWDAETSTLLAGWIEFVESSGKDLSLSRLLYVLPTGAEFDPAELPLAGDIKALVSTEVPVLLSLRERLPDTATYLKSLLGKESKAALGREALLRLLHYSWPGGYDELKSRIAKLKARLGAGESPGPADVATVLAERSEDPDSLKGDLDLAGYLKRRQREYIKLYRNDGEDLKDTLIRLGIDKKPSDPEAVLRDACLLYPELLQEANA